ncbi:MAG: hypothetical protein WCF18_04035 [Chthoniobacteraceae bacterium]
MFRSVSRFLVLIAAVQILGGHWAVLQTVAWTSMLIDNAKTASLTEAFAKTFDGTSPCSLCKAVTAGRSSEEKQDSTQLVKFEAVLAPAVQLPPREAAVHHFFATAQFERVLAVAPPTPPPRLS